jgi:MFS family permease
MPTNKPAAIDSAHSWFMVAAAFLGAFVSFGITYSFGVFLTPMKAQFHVGHAVMSGLFATVAALSFFLAPLTGKLADRFGPRPVVATGAILVGAGLFATAHASSLLLIFVTYGFGLGAGAACVYIPAIATVGRWFQHYRDLALGLAISGIGCGTLVAAPSAAILIRLYGWREATEIYGAVGAFLLLVCAGILERPPVAIETVAEVRSLKEEFRSRSFCLMYVSLFFAGVAVYVAFVFLASFSSTLGVSAVAGAALLGYIGAASVLGRLGLNALAPYFGLLTMYRVAFVFLLAGFGLWVVAHSYLWLVFFSIVMGVGYGGIAAMAPAVAAAFFGVFDLGELLGILFTGFGIACLLGPPLAGSLVDVTKDFRWTAYVAAAAAVLALAFVLPLRQPASDSKPLKQTQA